jgi:oligopeptide/dipeptide ABC transporter ATP-binding protein
MYAGRIVEDAATGELVRRPFHPYTKNLIDSAPDVDARQVDRFLAIAGQPPVPGSLPDGCPYQPRCARAGEICRLREPALEGTTRLAACWFSDDAAPAGDGHAG